MKLWKVDSKKSEVREVSAQRFADEDDEGDCVYDNSHFDTEQKAIDQLLAIIDLRIAEAGRDVRTARVALGQANERAAQAAASAEQLWLRYGTNRIAATLS